MAQRGGVQWDQEHVRLALAARDDFPVDRDPRPIVFTAAIPTWHDRAAAELRASRVFEAPAVAQSALTPEQLRAACDCCRDVNTLEPGPLGRIVRARMPFTTDRGERRLPAWIMLPDNRRRPFVALEPDFERAMTWHPAGLRQPIGAEVSTLAEDGRTLTFRFMAQPPAVADYPDAVVTETETAVHVAPIERWVLPADHEYPSVAVEREVVVRLGAGLGNRVLINLGHGVGSDTFGSPLTVISAAAQAS
jgi:hypothetical protein